MSSKVFEGPQVTLAEMLATRERRAAIQQEILQATDGAALVSATLNIPGPVKSSPLLVALFNQAMEQIEARLQDTTPLVNLYREEKTGPEYYLLVGLNPKEVKKRMVDIEENHPYGRLLDLDILWLEDDTKKSISRQELGLPSRRCYVCQQDAKICGRARKHSIEEMRQAIEKMIEDGKETPND